MNVTKDVPIYYESGAFCMSSDLNLRSSSVVGWASMPKPTKLRGIHDEESAASIKALQFDFVWCMFACFCLL
ncbi:hypothetical protein, partial [Bacillus sp. SIMBA_074]|uniref:hypothetical protein n=1 Tax=Bacillus sp. SIMBA_074 TaxID=3085812 RepID=UPI00397C3D64